MAGQSPNFPLAQKVSCRQGVQALPADALPWYPGMQVHWVITVLPSGDMELAGQVARTASGGTELVKPSTVRFALRIAVFVDWDSLAVTTTENTIESVVTCRSLRPGGERLKLSRGI